MAQLTRRANRTGLQATVKTGDDALAPIINFTDSKKFDWVAASPTDSGNDISRFYRVFAIQVVQTAAGNTATNYTLQANIGGEWVSCPTALLSAGTAVLTSANHDLIIATLPIHGVQLRLLGTATPDSAVDHTITILMSDSSERHDIGRV